MPRPKATPKRAPLIPGTVAMHATLTDEIRRHLGDDQALAQALGRLQKIYRQIVRGWAVGRKAEIHILLSVLPGPDLLGK